MYFYYDQDNKLIGFDYNGTKYVYVRNLQNDIIGIVDMAGNLVVEYAYDAWGNNLGVTDQNDNEITEPNHIGNLNPFRYRGYYWDSETEFYYLQSRYYDAKVGRFINADEPALIELSDAMLGSNLFAYCNNNPVMNTDSFGFIVTPANIIGAIIGGIIGAVGGYFLSRWLADKLNLSGWKRTVFISGLTALITAAAATIGYFVGPYVSKAWTSIKGALFSQCFVADTLIMTDIGDIPIQNIKEGDLVYSENPETGEKGLKPVIQVFVNETDTLITVTTETDKIVTTEEHPFWVIEKGWVFAKDLNDGDLVKLKGGQTAKVINIYIENLDTPIKVYNFEVEDWHTYFVSSSGVLVHNACGMSLNKLADSYIKNTLRLNAHSIKYEYLGSRAKIALYDLAVDKTTGIIYIIDKAGKIITETIYKTR